MALYLALLFGGAYSVKITYLPFWRISSFDINLGEAWTTILSFRKVTIAEAYESIFTNIEDIRQWPQLDVWTYDSSLMKVVSSKIKLSEIVS